MDKLRHEGIQSSIHYPPVHRFSFYRERFPGNELPKTEEFSAREISLPLHPTLQEKDIERVVEVLRRVLLCQIEAPH